MLNKLKLTSAIITFSIVPSLAAAQDKPFYLAILQPGSSTFEFDGLTAEFTVNGKTLKDQLLPIRISCERQGETPPSILIWSDFEFPFAVPEKGNYEMEGFSFKDSGTFLNYDEMSPKTSYYTANIVPLAKAIYDQEILTIRLFSEGGDATFMIENTRSDAEIEYNIVQFAQACEALGH